MHTTNPTTIVVFGATGDLFRKKLAPSLLNLSVNGQLPNFFRIVAFSRRKWSDDEFRNFLKESLVAVAPKVSQEIINTFLGKVFYTEGDFNTFESYEKVGKILARLDKESGVCTNKLFYLATPPAFYENILEHISTSGLAIPCAPSKGVETVGWTRILIEKPFGNNLDNALRLDKMLGKLFTENQIFRIDHYLAKETVQDILTFRFANAIFEPVWNRRYIERVEVKILEKGGIGSRGNTYDTLGALRDVGQNHLLQLLALVTMENPVNSTASALRKKRADVLGRFRLWKGKGALTLRGQYDGYLSENGVASNSETETYFKTIVELPNRLFKGVPFILESGKGLGESKVEVIVSFKQEADGMCPAGVCPYPGNQITFKIQPEETISLMYWAKEPGLDFALESRELTLTHPSSILPTNSLGAYERVLVDAIRGDQTLFASTDEVVAQWKIVHEIIKKWSKVGLQKYRMGQSPDIS